MPRYSKKSQYTQIDDRVIYILHSPISNEFFISHCRKDLLKDVYMDHLHGYRDKTYPFYLAFQQYAIHPCLHVLEEVNCTKVIAFQHVIAWTKLFCDHGYLCLDQGNVSCYIDDMYEYTQSVYTRICNLCLSPLLTCQSCVVKKYKRKICTQFKGEYL